MYEPKVRSRKGIALNEAASFILVTSSPISLFFYWITWHDFGASLSTARIALLSEGPFVFFVHRVPLPTMNSIKVYSIWILSQAVLYLFLPGPIYQAPRTPGGRQLLYKLNGLRAWIYTIAIAAIATYCGIIDPAFIAKHWGELLTTANFYCFLLLFVFYVKARMKPDNDGETLLTGHFWYDFFNGGELHPRTGPMFDWKHFHTSRTGGLLAWTLIDLSFAALQLERHGVITNSMILATVFRAIVVAEYFYLEHMFFGTLDGAHERVSFYVIYGFGCIMPYFWTLQNQYLAMYPVSLPTPIAVAVTVCFILGWAMCHDVNRHKYLVRQTSGKCIIWGKSPKLIEAIYVTSDGKQHNTVLLCSGWWGIARHANYTGTLLYTWASCFVCGTDRLFPYTEAIIVTAVLAHRCLRDEARCKQKYGSSWEKYCNITRWRMIPGIF